MNQQERQRTYKYICMGIEDGFKKAMTTEIQKQLSKKHHRPHRKKS